MTLQPSPPNEAELIFPISPQAMCGPQATVSRGFGLSLGRVGGEGVV